MSDRIIIFFETQTFLITVFLKRHVFSTMIFVAVVTGNKLFCFLPVSLF